MIYRQMSTFVLLALLLSVTSCSEKQESEDRNNSRPTIPQETPETSSQTAPLSSGQAGSLKLGMGIDTVTNILGKPDAVEDTFYKFLSHGIEINISSSKRTVHSITCLGSSFSLSPFYKGLNPYKGKTVEGIGIGSSKQDVIKAYGVPSSKNENIQGDSSGYYRYKDLGMTFNFDLGEMVNSIILSERR